MSDYPKWLEVSSDEDFAAIFAQNRVVSVTTDRPKTHILGNIDAPDIYWTLDDGRILAMYVRIESGCPTCGGADERYTEYHVTDRPVTP